MMMQQQQQQQQHQRRQQANLRQGLLQGPEPPLPAQSLAKRLAAISNQPENEKEQEADEDEEGRGV
jgi:hypothetical protein